MANASNVQTSFLSGEWSPYAQGMMDDPEYKKGMNVCRNIYPVESGAAVRRSGTRTLAYTRHGQPAKLLPFAFTETVPTTMEFTDGALRFYDNEKLILSEEPRRVLSISQGSPAQLLTTSPCTETPWANGDTVVFNFLTQGATMANGALVGRQFTITTGSPNDGEHWLLYDGLTGAAIDGTTIQYNSLLEAAQVGRVYEIDTPYTGDTWQNLRLVQDDDSVLLLNGTQPQTVFAPISGGNLYTFNPTQFQDGPYLDPPIDGSYLTTSGVSGVITMSIGYPAWSSSTVYKNGTNLFANTQVRDGTGGAYNVQYNAGTVVSSGGNLYVSIADNNLNHSPPNATWWKQINTGYIVSPTGFQSGDVGRAVRLFAEPLEWASGTSYTVGQLVTYQDAYYTALQATTGNIPGTDAVNWGVAANAAAWTWGYITSVTNSTTIEVAIQGDPLLYNQNVLTWRLGVYADSTSWPTCGAFHEGRFWLGGAVKNRFDASSAGDTYNFSPTAADGTVGDANAISYIFKSKQRNQIQWMTPALGGILMGTDELEWLVQSSVNNDVITPTNIQAHDHTSWGSANVEAVRTGQTVAFVQRYGNMVMEYLADLFSGKPSGKNLSLRAKHLTSAGIIRLAYQQELIPILWALTADNQLIGTTYKRESMMVSQPPNFNAWHRHDLGSGFEVIDMICSGSDSGLYQTPTLVTQDGSGYCRVEVLTDLFDETSPLQDSWFVDEGVIPSAADITSQNGKAGVLLSGLATLNGASVAAVMCGIDCGNYTVAAGQIFVPFQSDADQQFTLALMTTVNASGDLFKNPLRVRQVQASPVETIMAFPPISNTYLSHFTYLDYGSQALPDWKRDRVTFVLPGTGPYCGFIQYQISTGAFIQYVTLDKIFGATIPQYYDPTATYPASPLVYRYDGISSNKIYVANVSGSRGVDPNTSGQTDWIQNGAPSVLPTAWSSSTTYGLGNFVSASDGWMYASAVSGNLNHNPVGDGGVHWTQYQQTPAAWSATTTYGTVSFVMGDDDEIFWTLRPVAAGLGDPNSFSRNNNPYWGTLGRVWAFGRTTNSGLSLDFSGDIWMYQSETILGDCYIRIDGTTLKLKSVVGAPTGLSVPAPSNYSVPLRWLTNGGDDGADFLLETIDTTPDGSTEPSAILFGTNASFIPVNNVFVFDEGNSPIPAAGAQDVGTAQAFVLTRPPSGPATVASLGLYEINVQGVNTSTLVQRNHEFVWQDPNKKIIALYDNMLVSQSMRKAGTIAPASIDPTWVFFSYWSGLMFDPSDGNVISFANTQNPNPWVSTAAFEFNYATTLSYTVGSDNNLYKFLPPPVYNGATTYASGAVVRDTNIQTFMYQSLTNGNVGNPLTDGTHWAKFSQDPTTDSSHTYWQLIGPAATNICYMVKLSTDCAGVMWAIPVASPPSQDLGYQCVNIDNGYYDFLEDLGLGQYQVRRVFTLTGQTDIIFPQQQAGLTQLGGVQVFNGAAGEIVLYPQYDNTQTGTSAPPTPVNPEGGTTPSMFTGWMRWNVTTPQLTFTVPGLVGYPFTSQGQLLRPVAPAETGARNGPAFGKTRRNHRYAVALANAIGGSNGIKFGSTFSNLRPALLATVGGTRYLDNQLYTGEHSATLEDTYSYDGMICWQVERPVPAAVTALGGFLETNDR